MGRLSCGGRRHECRVSRHCDGSRIATETEIDGSARNVRDALVDFAAYPSWNPFLLKVDGAPNAGEQIRFWFELPIVWLILRRSGSEVYEAMNAALKRRVGTACRGLGVTRGPFNGVPAPVSGGGGDRRRPRASSAGQAIH